MSGRRFLCLGAGDGWHANQLREAALARGCELRFATYESLRASIRHSDCELECEAGSLHDFDAILTRTMPAGSLEQITFRLAMLHTLVTDQTTSQRLCGSSHQDRIVLVNPPRSLEIAIDKFATLAEVARLGYSVPDTIVAQSRREAIDAFEQLGGDCIVKPIFGGEGRGVMRIRDAELAWTTFSTLEQLGAICYVQQFLGPGGYDTRLLVIGDSVIGVQRTNRSDFRTNVASGGTCESFQPSEEQTAMARRICDCVGLRFGAVDLIDSEQDGASVIEVNAIPGWKGTQGVTPLDIAQRIIQLLEDDVQAGLEASC